MQLRRRRPKTTTEMLMEQVAELAERVSLLSGQAVVAIAPRIEDARDAAVIVYQEARTRVRDEYVPKVRDEYVPKVRDEYMPRVREEVGQRVREDVIPRARAAAASPLVAAALAKTPLRPEPPAPVKKTHKLRNAVLALGVGGGGAYAFSQLRSDKPVDTPPPAPAPARPTAVPDPVPAAPPSSDVSVGVDPAPATVHGDGPTLEELGAEVVYPEVGYSDGQPSDNRRPGDDPV
jgi:hypothetical protein